MVISYCIMIYCQTMFLRGNLLVYWAINTLCKVMEIVWDTFYGVRQELELSGLAWVGPGQAHYGYKTKECFAFLHEDILLQF